MHHLSVQTEGGLDDAADADIFSGTEQSIIFCGDEAAEREGCAIGVGVPSARWGVDELPWAVGILGEVLSASRVKINIELEAEHRVGWHASGPARFFGFGAEIVLGKDIEGFEAEAFADVGFGRESVGCAELVCEAHVFEGLRKVSGALMNNGLEVVKHSEGMDFCVLKDEVAEVVGEVDDV